MPVEPTRTVKVFYCYAREDKELRNELEMHLDPLRHSGQITSWHDREIQAGTEWKREIDTHLNTSNLILLLVSPHFMHSNYCYGIEMRRAIERYKAGEARVIPIILRPVAWEETPIGELQVLPAEGKPVTRWVDRDEALRDVTKGIVQVVTTLLSQKTKEQWMNEGDVHSEAQRYEEALLAYSQALLLHPNDADTYRRKGKTLHNLQRYNEALTAYEQALRLDPNDTDIYLVKGVILQGLERYDEALAAYEQIIRLDPDDVPRLFNRVVPPLFKQVMEDKQYMENVFGSIANGIITIDASGIITLFNSAASLILNLRSETVVSKHYQEAFEPIPQVGLIDLIRNAPLQQEHVTIAAQAVECQIPGREGLLSLNCHVSSLRDKQGRHIGIVLVIDDRTELKRSEAQIKQIRRIFERYVHPSIVQQLIRDPMALNIGGETKEISVVFAHIRGYVTLTERMTPEDVMNLINRYLQIMCEAIWEEEGTITAFQGDTLMAIFNAPLPQKHHALRAIRSAWKIHEAVELYQRLLPQETRVGYGIGINTGLATVGNVGSQGRIQSYTAIGDVVHVASHLQNSATDNTILLNDSTYIQTYQYVKVSQPFPLQVKNRSAPLKVRYLMGLQR